MTDAEIIRKLTHLHLKYDLGKMSYRAYKVAKKTLGRRQKYSRELGMTANIAARSVRDIIRDYPPDYVAVKRFTDVLLVSDHRLHTITLDFEQAPDDPIAVIENNRVLSQITAFAYYDLRETYRIETVIRTVVFTKNLAIGTLSNPLTQFIGDE